MRLTNLFHLYLYMLVLANISFAQAATEFSADEVIKRLQDGNRRYANEENIHPHIDMQRRTESANTGQHPMATVITCSDSRVAVELLFDQGIGDIFTIKVAGNVCDVNEIASIEYGIEYLQTPVLLVMGHSQCDVIADVIQHTDMHGNLPTIVDNIMPAVEQARSMYSDADSDALLQYVVEANVWQSIADLLYNSSIVRKRVSAGKLKIIGAVYNLKYGRVQWFGPHPKQHALLQTGINAKSKDPTGINTRQKSFFMNKQALFMGGFIIFCSVIVGVFVFISRQRKIVD